MSYVASWRALEAFRQLDLNLPPLDHMRVRHDVAILADDYARPRALLPCQQSSFAGFLFVIDDEACRKHLHYGPTSLLGDRLKRRTQFVQRVRRFGFRRLFRAL